MEKDFYLDGRGLAAYFAKDWIDHVKPGALNDDFAFAPFPRAGLYSDYHEKAVALLCREIQKSGGRPRTMLEIGSSLGRTYYEICRAVASLEKATLVEPSQNLAAGFHKIFAGAATATFQLIKGFSSFSEALLPTEAIRATCTKVETTVLAKSFQDLQLGQKFDLVICSNVIDQCKDPRELAEVVKEATARGGLLMLSCTYQWQNKYTGNAVRLIANVHELFGPGWRPLGEENIPFHVCSNERHWLGFLSHVVIYQRSDA